MDAVELPYPVDMVPASICKLMGSDGFGRVGAAVKEVGHRDLDRVTSNGWCSSSHGDKDAAIAINASESLFQDKSAAIECFRHNDQLLHFNAEDLYQNPCSSDRKPFQLPGPEESHLQCKARRVSRSIGKPSKRPRIMQGEGSSRISGISEMRDSSDKSLVKSTSLERNHSGKQRNVASKRGDKKTSKFLLKTKSDSFPVKAGSSVSSVSNGSSNPLGVYGLKTDINEVTKLVDDLSLNEILDGTFKCPNLGKEKGKRAANTNENVIQSVRKACAMLRPLRSAKSQNFAELDNSGDKSICNPLLSSLAMDESRTEGDSKDPCPTDLSPSNEVSCRKCESRHPLDTPLYSPKDLLQRLSFAPPRDLDSLLLEASKPMSSSKSASDLRLSKQLACRGGMPPFAWSHAFNGHCRSNSDTGKLPMSRTTTCPGKWVRMNPISLLGEPTDRFTSLDLITYNQSLVPHRKVEMVVSETKIAARESSTVHCVEWASSSAACSFVTKAPLECKAEMENKQANQSVGVLLAARTLCDIATISSRQNSEKMKWLKKPSQKAMKARKLKPDISIGSAQISGANNVLTNLDKTLPSKKAKLSTMDKCFSRAPLSWSAPRSSRTSPSRLHSVGSIVKQPLVGSENHQKPRKPVLPDWNRSGRDGFQ